MLSPHKLSAVMQRRDYCSINGDSGYSREPTTLQSTISWKVLEDDGKWLSWSCFVNDARGYIACQDKRCRQEIRDTKDGGENRMESEARLVRRVFWRSDTIVVLLRPIPVPQRAMRKTR